MSYALARRVHAHPLVMICDTALLLPRCPFCGTDKVIFADVHLGVPVFQCRNDYCGWQEEAEGFFTYDEIRDMQERMLIDANND